MDEERLRVVRGRIERPSRSLGVVRARLIEPLHALQDGQTAAVIAPAGCGKTTLLAQVASELNTPVAWLACMTLDGSVASFLGHLHAALGSTPARPTGRWRDVDAALADLDRDGVGRVFLFVDDAHALLDRPAGAALAALVEDLPRSVRLVLAARHLSPLLLHRGRLGTEVVELGPADLRFRTWEVEALFRDVYGAPLAAAEAAELTQRTAGWAAGLQLFHLATRGNPKSERKRVLLASRAGGRLTRDYLARTVLDDVSPETRSFLVRTSVFDVVTGPRCDALLGTTGSGVVLSQLERSGLFVFARDDGVSYQYHDVLRSFLLDTLTVELGEPMARELHRAAARISEREGAVSEALLSYSRSGEWPEVERLLSSDGERLAREPGRWIDALTPEIRQRDVWVLLAIARRLIADGAWQAALGSYREALAHLEGPVSTAPTAELRMLDHWLDPQPGQPTEGLRALRNVLAGGTPITATVGKADSDVDFASALALLVTGEIGPAAYALQAIVDHGTSGPVTEVVCLSALAVAYVLCGDERATDVARTASIAATYAGAPTLTRVVSAVNTLVTGSRDVPVDHLIAECDRAGDFWGSAAIALLARLGDACVQPAPLPRRNDLADELDALRLHVLATWVRVLDEVAARRDGITVDATHGSKLARDARRVGPFLHALALLATASTDRDAAARGRAVDRARQIATGCGTEIVVERVASSLQLVDAGARDWAPGDRPSIDLTTPPTPRLRITCFGEFTVERDETMIDIRTLKPKHAELLQLLALNANRVVHQERLIESIWPGRERRQGARSLQVAISTVRGCLDGPDLALSGSTIRREGEGYRLVLASDDDCDVRRIENAVATARVEVRAGADEAAERAYRRVLDHPSGEVLPHLGAIDWVVDEREQVTRWLTEASTWLATRCAALGDHAGAADVARRGLERDRYCDALWELACSNLDASGQRAAAHALRSSYRDLLAELDIVEAT